MSFVTYEMRNKKYPILLQSKEYLLIKYVEAVLLLLLEEPEQKEEI